MHQSIEKLIQTWAAFTREIIDVIVREEIKISREEFDKQRNGLKSERKLVFANFSNNPSNIRLALEIKVLDDRISDLDMALSKQRNSDGSHR